MSDIEKIKSLFNRALEQAEGETRKVWLSGQCDGRADLFDEVNSLLDAYESAQSRTAADQVLLQAIPAAIFGPYRAVELLGRGGTSTVYRAERIDHTFEQTVALKVLSPFMAGPEFARRFETEQRLLASLNHPHIAHLLDGGTSSAGDSYLAMEYVEGERFDRYCDRRKLPIDDRLRLFLQVCEAVEYAHRRMIVHRDLKPNNILVSAEGVVKLLDFGTGALLDAELDATVTRMRMLTPRYASPDRLRGEPANVADDVYSLGVILYETLTGAWPFGDPYSALSELQRAAGDSAPADLVSVVTVEAAENRLAPSEALRRKLAGDLSAIALKAIEYDSTRRYSTVRDLSDDVRNYLAARPIRARVPTRRYRLAKFLRRNWLPTTTAALAVLALTVAMSVALLQARRARAEALKATSVYRVLTGILSTFSTSDFDGEKFTVVQMLAEAEKRIETTPAEDALVEAIARRSIAESYIGLARFKDAQRELDRALPVLFKTGDQTEIAAGLSAQGYLELVNGNYAQAAGHFEQELQILQRLGNRAPSYALFEAKVSLVEVLSPRALNRDPERRRRLLREAIALGDTDHSIRRIRVAAATADLGELLAEEDHPNEAVALALQSLEIGRREEPGGTWEQGPLYLLSSLKERLGDLPAATEFSRQGVAVMANHAGENHILTATATVHWARLAARSGQAEAAVAAVKRCMPIIEKGVSVMAPSYWVATRDASAVMLLGGKSSEAEHYARACLETAQAQHLSDSDPRLGNSWDELGQALAVNGRIAEAVRCLEHASAIYRQAGSAWTASSERADKRAKQLLLETSPHRLAAH